MGKTHLQHRNERRARQRQAKSPTSKEYQKDNYQCQSIKDMKIVKGRRFYLIKWKGYDEKDNTWEPIENVLTLSKDILQFQNQKKQYVRRIETKWNLMYQNGQVREPLATNQLKKVEKEARKIEKELEIFYKQAEEKSRKIKKKPELSVRSKPFTLDRLEESQTRVLRNRANPNPIKSKQKSHEENIYYQSSSPSNSPFSNFSSQILNSALFEEKKCEIQASPLRQKQILQQPTSTVKKQNLTLFETKINQEQEKEEEQQQINQQEEIIQKVKALIMQPQLKPVQREIKKQSKQEVNLEINIQIDQAEKHKESSFKTSNYFFQTPKKNPIYCCNSPIQRSLNKYIYRIKPKFTTNPNEKEKTTFQSIPYYEAPVKGSLNEIISQKAEELQSSQNIKKEQLQEKENQQQAQAFNPVDPIKDNLEAGSNIQNYPEKLNNEIPQDSNEYSLKSNKQESQRVVQEDLADLSQREVIIVQQSNQSDHGSIKRSQIGNNYSKPYLQIVLPSESSQNEEQNQSQKLQQPITLKEKAFYNQVDEVLFQSIENQKIIHIPQTVEQKSRYLVLQNQQEHKTNLGVHQGLHYIINQFQASHYLREPKPQLSRIIQDNSSRLHPSTKTKKIAKAPIKYLIRHFSKQERLQQESELCEKPTYDLTSILTSCISSQELRTRKLKLERIVSMFKIDECAIFVIIIREESFFEQRFIAYNVMRDQYPRALLRYLQQNGKIQI